MTNFINDTNQTRVVKIVATVDLLIKSSLSNNAERDEIWQLMEPALERISELCNTDTPEAPEALSEPAPTSKDKTHTPPWVSIRQMAEQADLKDLTHALAVYLNRIDEVLGPKLE